MNPLAPEFTRQRIRLADIAHPVTNRIRNKRFVDCDLLGPATIVLSSTRPSGFQMNGTGLGNCDIVVTTQRPFINNVIVLEDVHIIGGDILKCTVYIHPSMVDLFDLPGANFVTLTGRPDIDGRPPFQRPPP